MTAFTLSVRRVTALYRRNMRVSEGLSACGCGEDTYHRVGGGGSVVVVMVVVVGRAASDTAATTRGAGI